MLHQAEGLMTEMASQQASTLASLVGEYSTEGLVSREGSTLNLASVEKELGVVEISIADSQGVVVAPSSRVGRSVKSHPLFGEANRSQSSESREYDGMIEVLHPIRAVLVQGMPPSIVGFSFLKFNPDALVEEAGRPGRRGLLHLVLLLVVCSVLFLGIWRTSSVPVRDLREETELAIRGHVPEVKTRTRWPELETLAHSINRILQRVEGGGAPADEGVDTLLAALPCAVLLLGQSGEVSRVNPWMCRLLGSEEPRLLGRPLGGVVTDPGLLSRLEHMLRSIAGGQGRIFSESVNFGGQPRRLIVAGEPRGDGGLLHGVVVVA